MPKRLNEDEDVFGKKDQTPDDTDLTTIIPDPVISELIKGMVEGDTIKVELQYEIAPLDQLLTNATPLGICQSRKQDATLAACNRIFNSAY